MTRAADLGRRAVAPLLLLLAALCGIRCVYDWDVWWHLRAGQWIVDHRTIPRVDPFGIADPAPAWINLQWLFQVTLWMLYESTGWWGPTFVQAAIATATMALCIAACGGWTCVPRLVVPLVAALLLVQSRFQLRPELLTFLLLAVLLVVLDRLDVAAAVAGGRPWPWLAVAVFVQLVWVNCHSLFILGPILATLFVLGTILNCILRPTGAASLRHIPLATWILPAALLGASMVNPYGWTGLTFPAVVFTRISGEAIEFTEIISEFHPTLTLLPHDPSAWLFLALVAGGIVSLVRSRRRMHWGRFLMFFAFAYLGFAARRNLPLFGVVAAVVIGQNARDRSASRAASPAAGAMAPPVRRSRTRSGGEATTSSSRPRGRLDVLRDLRPLFELGLLLSIAALLASGLLYRWFGIDSRLGVGVMPNRFPDRMAARLASEPSPVVFPVHIGYGNFFLWSGFPAVRSFIDGRLEVHDAVYPNYLEIVDDLTEAPARALVRLRALGVTHVAVPYASQAEIAMMRALEYQSEVSLRFVDGTGALFALVPAQGIDTESGGFGLSSAVDLTAPAPRGWPWRWFDPLPTARARQAEEHLRGATLLLHVFDSPQAAIRHLVAAGSEISTDRFVWANLALAFERLSDAAQAPAARTLRRAQAAYARNIANRLAGSSTSPAPTTPITATDVAVPTVHHPAVTAIIEGRYAEGQRTLLPYALGESPDEPERYYAHWLLWLIALDTGDREQAQSHARVLADSMPPSELESVPAEAAGWLERLQRSDEPPADPSPDSVEK